MHRCDPASNPPRINPLRIIEMMVSLMLGTVLCACSPPTSPPDGDIQTDNSAAESLPDHVPADADKPVRAQFRQAMAALDLARTHDDPHALAKKLGELGMLYHAYAYPEPARAYYQKASQLDGNDARWPYYLGHVDRDLGDFQAAASSFSTALDRMPESTAAQIWLAESYLDNNELDAAGQTFNKALLMDPACNHALSGLGRVALERGDNERAISYLARAVQVQPQVASLHYQLATAYRAKKDLESATGYMQNAQTLQTSDKRLRLDDPMMDAIAALQTGNEVIQRDALQAYLEGDFDTAVLLYRQALLIQPDNQDNRYNLALALINLDRKDEALAELEEALERQPNDVDSRLLLVRLHAGNQQLDKVEQHLVLAAEVDPRHGEVQLRLANLYRLTKRLEVAQQHYDRAIELNDSLTDAYIGKALVLIEIQQPAAAIDVLSIGASRNPGDTRLQSALTSLQIQLNSG